MRDAAPVTAPGLTHRFFSGAETFDFFQRKSNFSNAHGEFFRRNKADQSEELSVSTIYFPATQPGRIPKILSRNSGGGGCHALEREA
jgi:hypothetical protein